MFLFYKGLLLIKDAIFSLRLILYTFVKNLCACLFACHFLLNKDTPYETEEDCLFLYGVRKITRYENIEVEYFDMNWKNSNRN